MLATAGASVAREALLRALEPHRPYLALTLLACLLYLPSVWSRGLWSPDEPRYAEVAREMAASGDYILPRLNGAVYSEKPPFFFWLGIAASGLPGVTLENGPRLVSVLAAWGVLLMTFSLGRRLGEARSGWLSAIVLATSLQFVLHASSGVIDMTLTLFVVASIACGLSAQASSSPILWAGFYLMAGLAVFAKGPVGLLVPAMVMLISAWRKHGARGLAASHAAWGVPLALSVVALWLAAAIARGGEAYADAILFKQTVGRAYQSWHHRQPITYFLEGFPVLFLPWTLFFPAALYGAWRIARGKEPAGESGGGAPLALIWFASTFVFFSLISGKKTRYLLPLFPAASMLVGIELARLGSGGGRTVSRLRRLLPLAVAGIVVALFGGALVAAGLGGLSLILRGIEGLSVDQLADLEGLGFPPGGLMLAVPGMITLGLGAASLWLLRRDERASVACVVSGWLAVLTWAGWMAVPALDGVKSARHLALVASAAAARTGAGGFIMIYRDSFEGAFNFYLGRDRLPRAGDPASAASLLQPHPAAVVIARDENMKALAAQVRGLEQLDCRRLGDEVVCIAQYNPDDP